MAKSETIAVRVLPDTKEVLERLAAAENRSVSSLAEQILRNAAGPIVVKSSRRRVRVSDGERLILALLGDIYKHHKIKAEVDPDFVNSAINEGHDWGLVWKYSGLFDEHVDDDDTVTLTVDILDMWQFLELSFDKFTKSEMKEYLELAPDWKVVRFPGFDGNNEIENIGIARFLIEDLDRFTHFRGRDLNSHMPSIATHLRMLYTFEPLRKKLVGRLLSPIEVASIMNARRL